MLKIFLFFPLCAFFTASLSAQVPEWIWHPNDGANPTNNEVRFFRKTFDLGQLPRKATLTATGDDVLDVWVNGKKVLSVSDWKAAKDVVVTTDLVRGENVIALRGTNGTGDAAVLVRLEIDVKRGKKDFIVTDKTWKTASIEETNWQSKDFKDDTYWKAAKSLGRHGVQPWGEVIKKIKATAAEELQLLPGFKAELLWTSQTGEGSWICMTTDDKGRLIISPQDDTQQLWRVTLRSGKVVKKELIAAPVHQAMGLLYAHDSLYVNGHGPNGTGLYRLVDKNKNDRFDTNEFTFLKKIPGEGEHGYHALVLGPDKMIYMMNGNHTLLPEGVSPTSPHKNYKEDLLLPRQWDAGGHAVGRIAPGGYVLRTDKVGENWELMLGGFRNAYDFDFNSDGELFCFDSDMEWDWGLPWYRPTRINHCVTGGEYGWRSGSGVWPDYYPDNLPTTVDMGLGSPTGVKFGTKSKFPEKFRNALFAMDWSYGRIQAVYLTPKGATYDGTFETFVKGKPLNVADLDFGKDGAMYFITGGRATQSGLYRVTYVGKNLKAPKKTKTELANEKQAKHARELRHKLETFHGKKDSGAVDFAWPYLRSDDRWIRYAARIAIETQDISQWKELALDELDPRAGLTMLLALARVGGKETQSDLLGALKKFPLDSLSEEQKLEKLRIIEVSFCRAEKPEPSLAKLATDRLNRYYPATSEPLNRELCQLLVYLEAPDVVSKSLALLEKAKTHEDQLYYIFQLRNLKTGWTRDERKKYFSWLQAAQELAKGGTNKVAGKLSGEEFVKFNREHPEQLIRWFEEADRKYADGASYPKFLVNIRKDAIANLTSEERVALGGLVEDKKEKIETKPSKERKFVKEWKLSDLESSLAKVGHGRNFEQGKAAFSDAQCLTCHRYGNEGGSVGPELTVVSSRFSRRDILDSILEPSKVLSEQFQNFVITNKDGDDVTGRIVDESDEKIVVEPNPLTADRVEIKKSNIVKRVASTLSPMPEGLLNTLNEEEILDLLAYIESLGKSNAENFSKKKK